MQILIRALVLGASVFNLVACGQTGSLYLPTRSVASKSATTPQTAKPTEPAVQAASPRSD